MLLLYCQETTPVSVVAVGGMAGSCLLVRNYKLMKMRPFTVRESKPPAEPALDQRQIVQAALSLLDEVGYDGLTMRGLAKKLGIKAASLYWHIRDKQDLLSLLADEICAPMREPDRTLRWRHQFEEMANELRRILLSHRDAARVLASSGGPSGPNRLRLTEIAFRTLLDAGFDHKDAAAAGLLMNNFVTMFVLEETQYAYARAEPASEDSRTSVVNWVDALPPNEYPSIVALAKYLAQPDADEHFQFGVEILRSGLETRLQASHRLE